MPKTKAPVIHQCGTQWAVKRHGVVYLKDDDQHEYATLCGRLAKDTTGKKFDPQAENSCGRCVAAYLKRYAG